jgi:hypothetical protein
MTARWQLPFDALSCCQVRPTVGVVEIRSIGASSPSLFLAGSTVSIEPQEWKVFEMNWQKYSVVRIGVKKGR